MDVLKKINKDSRGVSSVLAEILIAAIFVIVITSIFAAITENDKPAESVHISAEEWVNASSDSIYIRHAGGDPIDVKDLKFNVMINGTSYEYSSSNISQNLGGKTVWELSDVIIMNTIQTWGISFSDESDVLTTLVDMKSNVVLSKYRISGKPIWIGYNLTIPSPRSSRGPVVADFDATPQSGEAPLSVSFTDTSSGSPTSWRWDFGDNSPISNLRNPNHEFTNAGTYNVTLTGIETGSVSTITKNITVNVPVIADFNAIPVDGIAPLSVNFTGNSTGSPTSWQWNFGDGSSNSTLPNPSHTFTNSGIYNITLTVTKVSYTSTITKNITVNAPVVADFDPAPSNGTAPLSVNFTGNSSGAPTSWQWNFGDGSSNSTLQNPSHVFTNIGIYNVTLTALKFGSSSTVTKNVTANNFNITGDTVTPTQNFTINLTVLGAQISYGGSYDMKVTTQLYIGNQTYPLGNYSSPVGSNVNDNQKHYWNLSTSYPAGTPVRISGRSWEHVSPGLNYSLDSSWRQYLEIYTTGNSQNLIVLKNGDAVPNKPGYLGQAPLATFVAPYVKNGKISLKANEAIFVFELGTTGMSTEASDFQDLVVLLSVNPVS